MAEHASFIVRMWHGPVGDQRVEIEHVQSGSRARLASLGVVSAWLASHADGAPMALRADSENGVLGRLVRVRGVD